MDGTTFRALRVTARPINYGSLGMYRLGMHSGIIDPLLAANAELFQWRWDNATNLGLVYQVSVSAGANAGSVTALPGSLVMVAARAWTAAGSGGTRAVLTGNISKLRTSMGSSLVNDAGIASTGALTAGTKTIDHATSNMSAVSFGIGTGLITANFNFTFLPRTVLFDAYGEGMHPLVCAQNEGFIIRNGTVAFPEAMTWVLAVNCLWAEAAAF